MGHENHLEHANSGHNGVMLLDELPAVIGNRISVGLGIAPRPARSPQVSRCQFSVPCIPAALALLPIPPMPMTASKSRLLTLPIAVLGRAVPRMSGSKVPLRCARNARTIWRASAGGNQNVLYALFNHEC